MKTSLNGHLRRPFALYSEICPLFNHAQNANVLKNNGVENIIISRGILMKGNTKGNAVYHIWRSGIMTKSRTENLLQTQCDINVDIINVVLSIQPTENRSQIC